MTPTVVPQASTQAALREVVFPQPALRAPLPARRSGAPPPLFVPVNTPATALVGTLPVQLDERIAAEAGAEEQPALGQQTARTIGRPAAFPPPSRSATSTPDKLPEITFAHSGSEGGLFGGPFSFACGFHLAIHAEVVATVGTLRTAPRLCLALAFDSAPLRRG